MKRQFLFIITLLISIHSYAQKNGFGIHTGVVATGIYNLSDGLDNDFEPAPGITIGARYNFKFGPIGLCAELNYISKQYERIGETNIFGDFYEYANPTNLTQNYISMPLLLKFYVGPFNIHGGFQSAYLLNGSTQDVELGSTAYDDAEYYYTVNGQEYWVWEDIDVAAVFGFGLDLNMGLYMSCRGAVSLTPIKNMDWINAVNDEYNAIGSPDLFDSQFIDELGRLVTSEITIGYKF